MIEMLTAGKSGTVIGVGNIKDIAVKNGASMIVNKQGDLYSYGTNSSAGYLGTGNTNNLTVPTLTLTNVRSVYMSLNFSLAIKEDNTIWSTGTILGIGANSTAWQDITSVFGTLHIDMRDISVHPTLAMIAVVTSSGDVYNVGNNTQSVFGNGNTTSSSTFVKNTFVSNVKKIVINITNCLVVTTDNTCYVGGRTDFGMGLNGSTYQLIASNVVDATLDFAAILYANASGIWMRGTIESGYNTGVSATTGSVPRNITSGQGFTYDSTSFKFIKNNYSYASSKISFVKQGSSYYCAVTTNYGPAGTGNPRPNTGWLKIPGFDGKEIKTIAHGQTPGAIISGDSLYISGLKSSFPNTNSTATVYTYEYLNPGI